MKELLKKKKKKNEETKKQMRREKKARKKKVRKKKGPHLSSSVSLALKCLENRLRSATGIFCHAKHKPYW
jgi:hypothetical protein